MNRTATCCCGQLSIEVSSDPKLHLVCNCNDCKKRTGSAFGISAYFADQQIVRKSGETGVYAINNEETEQKRYFCNACGSTLYWKISRFPGIPNIDKMTGIAGGCFTEHPLPPPTMSAADANKCVWLHLPELKILS